MSFGDIVGQLLKSGMSGQTQSRLQHAAGDQGLGGFNLDQMLGSVLGGGASQQSSGGGLGGLLGGLLGGGGSSSGGGIGALAGALLGGGRSSGPLGGSAMGLLTSLAMKALQSGFSSPNAAMSGLADIPSAQIEEATSPVAEKLILRAMIAAAKADGNVSDDEMQRILGKINDDGVSAEEKAMIVNELQAPLNIDALVVDVPNPVIAAQVYASSLLAIDIDTPQEMNYLRQLAAALQLDSDTVQQLHQMTGAPQV